MKKQYMVTAALGMCLTTPLWANDNTAGDTGGFWSEFKVNTLGMAPGAKPFYFRAGYTLLSPDASSSEVRLSNVDGEAGLAISNGPIAGSGNDLKPVDFPSAIIGYQLPWGNGQWAVETVLALPLEVEFTNTGTLKTDSIAPYALNNIPTGVPALGREFGEAKALPPVVTLVYRFMYDQPIRPYLGAGIAMLFTYDAEVTNPVLTAVNQPKLEIDPVMGYALQAGVEFNVWKNWWVNADVKFVGGLEAAAKVKGMTVETPGLPLYDVVQVGDASVDVTVDPWVYHIGIGFNF